MKSYILGTDWWTDCDDAVAIRILARAHRRGEINLLGVVLNACMEDSVASLDGFLSAEGISLSIGLDFSATDFGGKPRYQKNLTKRATRYKSNDDAESAVRLYRRLLASAKEKGAEEVITACPLCLYNLQANGGDILPVKYFTELLAEALGVQA